MVVSPQFSTKAPLPITKKHGNYVLANVNLTTASHASTLKVAAGLLIQFHHRQTVLNLELPDAFEKFFHRRVLMGGLVH